MNMIEPFALNMIEPFALSLSKGFDWLSPNGTSCITVQDQ